MIGSAGSAGSTRASEDMDNARFRIGDAVSITDLASPYYADEGRVLAILVGKYPGTPEKYDVVFVDGTSAEFWEAQLKMKPA